MPVSLIYIFVRMLLGALLPGGRDDAAKELGIVVLGHQIGVPRRQVARPRFRPPRWLSRNRARTASMCSGAALRKTFAHSGPTRTGRSTDDAKESRSVGLPVFGPPRPDDLRRIHFNGRNGR
jgi:hypothetical protein